MLTITTAKQLVKEIRRIAGEAGAHYAQAETQLREAIEKDTMLHWLTWNALSYARAKGRFAEWTSILNGVVRMFGEESQTFDEVVQVFRGYRDGMVSRILQADQSNKSTSVMTNALRDEEIQVLRSVVGVNILDGNSLKGILIACGVTD